MTELSHVAMQVRFNDVYDPRGGIWIDVLVKRGQVRIDDVFDASGWEWMD
jgi:hypothetical protein